MSSRLLESFVATVVLCVLGAVGAALGFGILYLAVHYVPQWLGIPIVMFLILWLLIYTKLESY